MPIYEYQCQACGDVQEVMQKISDPAPAGCEKCHDGPLQKLMSRTAFILKGEGWYVTDFRDKKKTKPDPETKSEPKADEKPAAETSGEGATKADAPKTEAAPASSDKPAVAPASAPVASTTTSSTPAKS